jgi:hypothetical protein
MSYSTRFDLALGDYSDPSQHLLLLQVSDDAIQLLATDQQRQPLLYQLVQFHEGTSEPGKALADWLRDQAIWLQQWSQIIVVHQCIQAAIVPAAFFNVDNGKELLDLQFGDLFRGTLLTEQITSRQDYSVYRIPTEDYLALMAAHSDIQHRHIFSLWINWLDRLPIDPNGQAYLLFETNRVLMAIRQDDWLLIHQYEYQAPEDISYYLLAACKQYNLSPESLRLSLDGWIDTHSSMYLELSKYFRHPEIVSLPKGIKLDTSLLQDQPVHFFTPLIQMAQCV